MTALLWTFFITVGLGVVIRGFQLAYSEYPRSLTFTRGEDVFLLFLHGALAIWIAYLLFH